MSTKTESGQGLTEYALIIAFIALIVIVVLALMGPSIRDAFDRSIATIRNYSGQASSVITSVSASRSVDVVTVIINVSTSTKVDVVDSGGAPDANSVDCPGSCTVTMSGSSGSGGVVSVSAYAGGVMTASYP